MFTNDDHDEITSVESVSKAKRGGTLPPLIPSTLERDSFNKQRASEYVTDLMARGVYTRRA